MKLNKILLSLLDYDLELTKKCANQAQGFGLSQVLLDYDRPLYIWGCGELSKTMAPLFQKINIPIKGFIDSFVSKDNFKKLTIENINYKIYGPDHLKKNNADGKPVIIIAQGVRLSN